MLPEDGSYRGVISNITHPLHEVEGVNGQSSAVVQAQARLSQRQEEGEEWRRRQHIVEADGSIFNGDRDAPGQSCVYIPPGDHSIESYRLATFSEFPKSTPVKPTDLAMIGFYYTGFRDRVKCFSCGMCVENFMLGDSAFDQRWHFSDCKMIIGQETTNVPTHMSHLRIMFMQFTGKPNPNLQLSANNFSFFGDGQTTTPPEESSGVEPTAPDECANVQCPANEKCVQGKSTTSGTECQCIEDYVKDSDGNCVQENHFSGGPSRNITRRLHEVVDENDQSSAGVQPQARPNAALRERGEEWRCRRHIVEADGTVVNGDRDAPGQSCVYIPPGDHFIESYRLATFSEFPKSTPVKPTDLAMIGFYYTGFRDRVKCFSCGMCVENFMLGDSAFDQRWHFSDCKMLIGQETTNVPTHMSHLRIMFMQFTGKQNPNLQLSANNFSSPNTPVVPMEITDVAADLTRVRIQEQLPKLIFGNIVDPQHERFIKSLNLQKEAHRRKTFSKWPSYPCPSFPRELAKDGFFYLGNLDRVQCFSCSGVLRNWAPEDVVREQHIRHFRQCKMATETDPRNESMTSNQRHNADEEDRARMALMFSNENNQEPPDPSQAEQRHLAQYYPCNHAINPHMRALQRRLETFNRWPRDKTRATPEQMAAAGLFYLGESDKTKCFYCNGGLQNWDYNDEPWIEHAKWFPGCEFVLRSKGTEFVRRLTEMNPNLNRPNIRNAVSYMDAPPFISRPSNRQVNMEETIPAGVVGAVGGIVTGQKEIMAKDRRPGKNDDDVQPKKPRTSSPRESLDSGLATSLREIEESLVCRVCKVKQAEAIVLPCAHLCACNDCVTTMKKCAVCDSKVRDTMKVFRA